MASKSISRECYICDSPKPRLVSKDGKTEATLTATEYKILEILIENKNKAVYLADLGNILWGANSFDKDENSLRSHISRIKKKLNAMEEGLGYCITQNKGLHSYVLNIDDPIIEEQDKIESLHEMEGKLKAVKGKVYPAQYADLKEKGYDSILIAEALVKNDMELYASGFQKRRITPENEGSVEQWAEYLSSVPETFQYLINSKSEIVGNFSFLSITEEQEREYLQGNLVESCFSPDTTRDLFSAGKDHILFLLNLSINDEYSTSSNNTILRKMFLEELIALAQNDIYFKKIITNVYKSSQEAFYKQWGFQFIKDHPLSGRIYELRLMPYPKLLDAQLKKNSRLVEANERLKKLYEQ